MPIRTELVSIAARRAAVWEHTVWIVIAAEADDNQALILTEDGLVDVPGSAQVRQHNRTHG